MVRAFLLFIFCLFYCFSSFAQQGEWIWLDGDSTSGSPGSYGTQGVASPANEPVGMYEPCQWTDTSGNFWLYGGYDFNGDILNDLWMYNPVTNEWTWVNGTHTVNDAGSYGTMGIASPTNRPPSRSLAPVSWVDKNNNLWMFGGGDNSGGFSLYNELWKYDISSNEWTWMKGSIAAFATGVYGVKGTFSIANTPGARGETSASWTDNAGDLWFLGGLNGGSWNDLWRFNIASNSWAWMNGSNTTGALVSYGTKSVEATANAPGGIWAYSSWKDASGYLWFWGGVGRDSSGAYGVLNDLWRYNTVTNNWTWINGDAKANTVSRFGSKCIASPNNTPGGRYENRASWIDASGNFWIFGGLNEPGFHVLNDLWMYCVATNQWTWVSGDSLLDPSGFWGAKGVASPANKPSGRAGAVSWTDNKGHLYLFGGEFAESNDLWEFTIDNACGSCALALPVASFQSSDSVFCANDCINYTDLSLNATSWQWSFAGGNPTSSTVQNPSVCYTTSGNYNVTLIASNSGGSDTLNINNFITVHPAPPAPVITQSNDTLFCKTDTSYLMYQWYNDTASVAGATDTFLVVTQNGNYNLQVTSANGCMTATGINVDVGIQKFIGYALPFSLSPNPAGNELRITNAELGNCVVEIYNVLGEKLRSSVINHQLSIAIDVSSLPAGVYFVRIASENERWVGKFVHE